MAGYEIAITAAASKELDDIPRRKERQAVVERILALAADPRPLGCLKLAGVDGLYRIRQGRYRVVYGIEDDRLLVIVIRVGDRKDVYRGTGGRSTARTRPFPEKKKR